MLTQPNSSAENLDKSSSMPIIKARDTEEASLATINLPPENGINQMGEISKAIKSRS